MGGGGGAKGHPSAFGLPWLSSKILRAGPQAGKRQGKVTPPSTEQSVRSECSSGVRKVRQERARRPRMRIAMGGGSSANSGVSSPSEDGALATEARWVGAIGGCPEILLPPRLPHPQTAFLPVLQVLSRKNYSGVFVLSPF